MKSAGELAAISIGGDDRDNIFWSRASGFGCGRQTRDLHLNTRTWYPMAETWDLRAETWDLRAPPTFAPLHRP